MAELVHGSPVPVDGLEIRLRPRHLYEIMDSVVEGTVAANAEVSTRPGDQRLGVRQYQSLGTRCGGARQCGREIFALVGVENREPLEKRNRIGLVSVAFGAPVLLVGHKTIGVDNGRAVFSLADMSAEAERLAKREPVLSAEAVLDHGAQRISTLMPEYWRSLAAFFGIASDALAATVPHG